MCKDRHSERQNPAGIEEDRELDFHGDNAWYVLAHVIPHLRLSDYDKQVMRWCYEGGWELKSDGETLVKDMFLDGKIKDPAGVVHDYINRVEGHRTPDGHVWTVWESNALYRRIKKALGAGWWLRWRRWIGVTGSFLKWWRSGWKWWQKP